MDSAVLLPQQGPLLAGLAGLSDPTAQLTACDRAERERESVSVGRGIWSV